MAAYTITRQGSTLRFVEAGGDQRVFSLPSFRLYPVASYPSIQNPCIEVRQGDVNVLQLQVADIVTINGVAPASGATLAACLDALNAIPGGNLPAQTAASGTTAVAFGSQACSQLSVFNGSGTAIDVLQSGVGITLPSGASFVFSGLTNANQLSIRRTDQAATQVIVGARWLA